MRTIKNIQTEKIDFYANKKDCFQAFKELSNRGKQLYIYFITCDNNSQIFPDPLIIEEEVGLNHKYYEQIFNELINKGYLHQRQGIKDSFIFFSKPFSPLPMITYNNILFIKD